MRGSSVPRLLGACLLLFTLPALAQEVSVPGDLVVKQTTTVNGTLTVGEDLIVRKGAVLTVTGDLVVGARIVVHDGTLLVQGTTSCVDNFIVRADGTATLTGAFDTPATVKVSGEVDFLADATIGGRLRVADFGVAAFAADVDVTGNVRLLSPFGIEVAGTLTANALRMGFSAGGQLFGSYLSAGAVQLTRAFRATSNSIVDMDLANITASNLVLDWVPPEPNQAPTVELEGPFDGDTFFAGQEVLLLALATDAEDGDVGVDLQWTSDLDGDLGTGDTVPAFPSVGTHVITAVVIDSGGQSSEPVSFSITIVPAPTVTIVEPGEGAQLISGVPTTFRAVLGGGSLPGVPLEVQWFIDGFDFFGAGGEISIDALPLGPHSMVARVLSPSTVGALAEASINFFAAPNQNPSATIISPTNVFEFEVGQVIPFEALLEDDGDVSLLEVEWTSHRQGPLGTGPAIFVDDLEPGLHTIAVNVIDPGFLTFQTSIDVFVGWLLEDYLPFIEDNRDYTNGGYRQAYFSVHERNFINNSIYVHRMNWERGLLRNERMFLFRPTRPDGITKLRAIQEALPFPADFFNPFNDGGGLSAQAVQSQHSPDSDAFPRFMYYEQEYSGLFTYRSMSGPSFIPGANQPYDQSGNIQYQLVDYGSLSTPYGTFDDVIVLEFQGIHVDGHRWWLARDFGLVQWTDNAGVHALEGVHTCDPMNDFTVSVDTDFVPDVWLWYPSTTNTSPHRLEVTIYKGPAGSVPGGLSPGQIRVILEPGQTRLVEVGVVPYTVANPSDYPQLARVACRILPPPPAPPEP